MKFKDLFNFKKKEIDEIFKKIYKKDRIEGLKLLQSPIEDQKEQNHGKLLIITPKKSGKAHKRNKIKRQLKSIFFQEKLFLNPINSVIIVYKQAFNLDFQNLKNFLIKNLDKNEN